ncbi:unnamed protein product [Microthlaspi erraticum]|uniref:Major facilitator superfamily (MFS) profile domain-containing protein n=1 Tax=Microthlaspi erraticum TaxID=1685480 RepID=A0A6D2JNV9_9BRAS|nr:unnamed protein product [Microthlaspi erraticum]
MRGGLGSVNQLSVTIGIMLAYLLGLFVPWRILAVLGVLPMTILIPGLFFIPESPRWLAKMGMTDDFETSLQVLRGFETDITVEVNEIKRSVASSSKRSSTVRFVDLKRRRYYFPLLVQPLNIFPFGWYRVACSSTTQVESMASYSTPVQSLNLQRLLGSVYDKDELVLSGTLEMSSSNGYTSGESKHSLKRWNMNCEAEITAGSGFLKSMSLVASQEHLSSSPRHYSLVLEGMR